MSKWYIKLVCEMAIIYKKNYSKSHSSREEEVSGKYFSYFSKTTFAVDTLRSTSARQLPKSALSRILQHIFHGEEIRKKSLLFG